MSEPKLNAHGSETVRELFEENTSEIRNVGDIVDKHAGDSLIFTQNPPGERQVDGGESEFVDELLPTDPEDNWESADDSFLGDGSEDEESIGETDITGTAAGIARGFGSHLALDLGADGFQIEEAPTTAMGSTLPRKRGEELDDYDDDDDSNGKFDMASADETDTGDGSTSFMLRQTDQTIPQSRFELKEH